MSEETERYVRVAKLDDVPDGGLLAVQADGRPLVLVRRGRTVHALDDACPHAGAPLSEGMLEEGILTCAWHGWSFRVEDGDSVDGSGAQVGCHAVRLDGDDIHVQA